MTVARGVGLLATHRRREVQRKATAALMAIGLTARRPCCCCSHRTAKSRRSCSNSRFHTRKPRSHWPKSTTRLSAQTRHRLDQSMRHDDAVMPWVPSPHMPQRPS